MPNDFIQIKQGIINHNLKININMENEQMNQQPAYEQLIQAYNNLVRELDAAKMELQMVKTDKLLEKLETMLEIIRNNSAYPKEIVKLATWHAKQMMAKPKN